eukprot:CAMPEP_0177581632 /NCGR_PEP_ID=MMETSP0419_2-20121207/2258_1 /TAXON_ID=582737 /ORGANISM="Tetraselmis sp., Strain GSL018" /LENGTH=337 /DNA_ID=CAMNT_0019070701 /DNA_START=446 /DNA_END=1456 /DNA_ORIENTATION=+
MANELSGTTEHSSTSAHMRPISDEADGTEISSRRKADITSHAVVLDEVDSETETTRGYESTPPGQVRHSRREPASSEVSSQTKQQSTVTSLPWAQVVSKGRNAREIVPNAEAMKLERPAQQLPIQTSQDRIYPKMQDRNAREIMPNAEATEVGASGTANGQSDVARQDIPQDAGAGHSAGSKPEVVSNGAKETTDTGAVDGGTQVKENVAKAVKVEAPLKPSKPLKPAWNKPSEPQGAENKAPLSEIQGEPTWPSLGDAKSERNKKRSLEPTQQASRGSRGGSKGGKGFRHGRKDPMNPMHGDPGGRMAVGAGKEQVAAAQESGNHPPANGVTANGG